MLFRRSSLISLSFGALLLAPTLVQAHERDFAFLRDWFLPYKFEREFEYRYSHVKGGDFNAHELEFEYGINDHFAIEPGLEWVKEEGGKFHLDGWDTELRFNFGDFQSNKWLPAINLEYEHPIDKEESDHAELKMIGSMYDTYGNDFSVNLNVGWALEGNRAQESEILLGFMHPTRPGMGHRGEGFKYGFEFAEDLQEHHAVLGPTVTFRANEHMHIVTSFAFGLNSSDDNTFKLIAEYEF